MKDNAQAAGLLQCRMCHYLCRKPEKETDALYCPRCQTRLQLENRSSSIQTTWALTIAAFIMFFPANFMPIMSFHLIGQGSSPSTIMEGVVQLWDANQWPLAVLVFVASVVVPILKILAISFLLLSIQFGSRWHARSRMNLYKFTEFIGRWSMVDIFVVAILVGVVQFGNLAHVEANMGSLSFTAVVILTMLAARTLDEHLIWDMTHNKD